ncbi:MAG: RNA polymerase sigma-70 factor (ECF subfamily) [Saprospiraceae bacterium]|jgi:RNA polymerase sigma-70 factor (ECF subfamily)
MSYANTKYHQSKSQIATEEQQIVAAKKNPQRFDVIYDKYFLAIYKYILVRVENKNLTDDIVSKVFAKALYKLHQYKFKGLPFSSWLYRIAYNEMNDAFRRNKAHRTVHVPIEQLGDMIQEEDETDAKLREQQIKMLLNGIGKLNKDEIELLELRYFEKRPFREVGEILNITEENAKVKTHRVVKKLRQIIEQHQSTTHEQH